MTVEMNEEQRQVKNDYVSWSLAENWPSAYKLQLFWYHPTQFYRWKRVSDFKGFSTQIDLVLFGFPERCENTGGVFEI